MESVELKNAEIIESRHDEIEARKSSGMGIKEWCNHRGYPESRYYYHLRMIRRMKKEKEEPGFALLPAPTSEVREGKVTQNKVIVKYGEYSVEIPDGFSISDHPCDYGRSEMLNDYVCPGRVHLALRHTDLRKGIDELAVMIQEHYGKSNDINPYEYLVFALKEATGLYETEKEDEIKYLTPAYYEKSTEKTGEDL